MMISLLIPWFHRAFGRFGLEIRRQYYCTAFYRGSSRQIARRVAPRRLQRTVRKMGLFRHVVSSGVSPILSNKLGRTADALCESSLHIAGQ